jgi:2-succinyl-6-hydroxy-2,4-cyclohexadiene-1-carboxylate synthase
MSRIQVNGVRMETRVADNGPPVLLLHGFTGRGASWAAHLPALRRTHRTIVVDLLGHGRSDAPADPARYALDCQAADMAAVLEALRARPADVIGYSMGARIGLHLALDHPRDVRRLVLESPSAGIADAAERARRRADDEELALIIERDGIPAFLERWEAQPVFASHAALAPVARARLRRQRQANRAAGLAASLRGAGQGIAPPVHHRLPGLRAPVLLLCGELDRPGCDRAATMAAALPDGRLEVVAGVGHTPHLEDPTTFRRLVLGFLDEPGTMT